MLQHPSPRNDHNTLVPFALWWKSMHCDFVGTRPNNFRKNKLREGTPLASSDSKIQPATDRHICPSSDYAREGHDCNVSPCPVHLHTRNLDKKIVVVDKKCACMLPTLETLNKCQNLQAIHRTNMNKPMPNKSLHCSLSLLVSL